MKIHTVVFKKQFNAPVEKVWEDFNNHENLGKIFGQKMTRIKDSSNPNNINGIHSVRKIHIPILPFEETIRKSEKPNCIEYRISKGTPLSHHYGIMLFEAEGNNKTNLHYTIEIGSKIPLLTNIVAAILKNAIGNSLDKYAANLLKQ